MAIPYFDLGIFFQLFQLDNMVPYFLQSIFQELLNHQNFSLQELWTNVLKYLNFTYFWWIYCY